MRERSHTDFGTELFVFGASFVVGHVLNAFSIVGMVWLHPFTSDGSVVFRTRLVAVAGIGHLAIICRCTRIPKLSMLPTCRMTSTAARHARSPPHRWQANEGTARATIGARRGSPRHCNFWQRGLHALHEQSHHPKPQSMRSTSMPSIQTGCCPLPHHEHNAHSHQRMQHAHIPAARRARNGARPNSARMRACMSGGGGVGNGEGRGGHTCAHMYVGGIGQSRGMGLREAPTGLDRTMHSHTMSSSASRGHLSLRRRGRHRTLQRDRNTVERGASVFEWERERAIWIDRIAAPWCRAASLGPHVGAWGKAMFARSAPLLRHRGPDARAAPNRATRVAASRHAGQQGRRRHRLRRSLRRGQRRPEHLRAALHVATDGDDDGPRE